MNNFIFKSANRLIKNSPITLEGLILDCLRQIEFIQKEQRMQRSDLKTVNDKLDKLLVDKHLQMQVDEYFNDETSPQTELEDK